MCGMCVVLVSVVCNVVHEMKRKLPAVKNGYFHPHSFVSARNKYHTNKERTESREDVFCVLQIYSGSRLKWGTPGS